MNKGRNLRNSKAVDASSSFWIEQKWNRCAHLEGKLLIWHELINSVRDHAMDADCAPDEVCEPLRGSGTEQQFQAVGGGIASRPLGLLPCLDVDQ